MDYKDFKELKIDLFTDNIVGYVKYKNGSGDYVVSWTELPGVYGEGTGLTCYEFVTMKGCVHRLRMGTEPIYEWMISSYTFDFSTRHVIIDPYGRPEEQWLINDNILSVCIVIDGCEKEFRNAVFDEELKKKGVAASFQEQGSLTESKESFAGYAKVDCLAIQNAFLTKDKIDLKCELEKTKKQLEESQELIKVLKKEIDNLKWEKTWYDAHYTEAKKYIKELQEKLDNATRSYNSVVNNLYKKKKQFKEAMDHLKRAEFYMRNMLDTVSLYPNFYKGVAYAHERMQKFILEEENKED